ncbi:MAG: hypothetical protein ACJ79K_05950 [Gemmatimonadaceae bacterium]
MQRPITLLTICAAIVACRASAYPRADVQVAQPVTIATPVRTGHAGVDLSGAWTTGSGGEPAAQLIYLHPECNYSPALWIIEQEADTVRAWQSPASHAQGIATTEHVRAVPAEGWISGLDVTIGTAGARYVLRYDSTSAHLRGTFNGAPFWAARVEVVQPKGCIPVP